MQIALKFVFHVIIMIYARRYLLTKLINKHFENAFQSLIKFSIGCCIGSGLLLVIIAILWLSYGLSFNKMISIFQKQNVLSWLYNWLFFEDLFSKNSKYFSIIFPLAKSWCYLNGKFWKLHCFFRKRHVSIKANLMRPSTLIFPLSLL